MANPNSNEYRLLTVLQSYSPNDSAQQQCSDLLAQMEHDRLSSDEIVAALAGYLVDGLRFGNWLWTFPRRGTSGITTHRKTSRT